VTGLAALALPSFGYIVGFVAASALVGWLAQLEWDRKFVKMLVTFAAGSAVIYAFGVPWLAVALGVDIPTAIGFGVVPFLIGDAIKAVAAAGLLPLAWLGVRRLHRDR
jgi:biotin transport system substrate-specific component